ncbi:MAG: hypothetical protein JETCAE03_34800 [Ignavibacteriaceae bacterium]|jgi:hypothetical protein|nr:MAG: hypothetical protein JETCAE03_34800 [Ignavibacteriaceae bacterium]
MIEDKIKAVVSRYNMPDEMKYFLTNDLIDSLLVSDIERKTMGRLEYKCRRCGAIEDGTHTPNVLQTIICVMNNYDLPKEWLGTPVTKTSIHNCKDGGIGVSDFIGGIGDKE